MFDDFNDRIYCKECPNLEFIEYIEEYYCCKYNVEIEDISRDYCDLEIEY